MALFKKILSHFSNVEIISIIVEFNSRIPHEKKKHKGQKRKKVIEICAPNSHSPFIFFAFIGEHS